MRNAPLVAGSEGVALGQFPRLDPVAGCALIRDTIEKAAAVALPAVLKVWREFARPRAVIDTPENVEISGNASALIVRCGSLYRTEVGSNLGVIVTWPPSLPTSLRHQQPLEFL